MSRPMDPRPNRRLLAALSVGLALGLAACASSASPPATSTPVPAGASNAASAATTTASGLTSGSPAPASATPRPRPTGPATAALTLAGSAGGGAATSQTIRCETPSLDGLTIDIFGSTSDPGVGLRVTLTPGHVVVRESGGSGTTFFARDYEGSGVTAFDAHAGATVDGPLAEVSPAGQDRGALPNLTSIKGTVDCGNETAGTSSLVFTGQIPEGRIAGGLDPVSVECIPYAAGDRVSVIGLASAGSVPVLMVMTLAKDSLSVAAWPKGAATSRFFNTISAGSVSLVSGGAHLGGDPVEPYATANALSLHVAGDVTCGWTASP